MAEYITGINLISFTVFRSKFQYNTPQKQNVRLTLLSEIQVSKGIPFT